VLLSPAWRVPSEVDMVCIFSSPGGNGTQRYREHDILHAFWDIDDVCADPSIDVVDCGTRPDIRPGLVKKFFRKVYIVTVLYPPLRMARRRASFAICK
jgi:predicted dehydrogenase